MLPYKLVWYLTSGCTESCLGCPFANSKGAPEELTTEQALHVVSQLIHHRFFSISYTGGEPTLRKDLFEIIGAARQAKIFQFLATNGRKLDAHYTRELKNLGIKGVALSIDHSVASMNDQRRGAGAFDAVMNASEVLRSNEIPFSISMTVSDNDLEEILSVGSLSKRIGAESLRVQAKTDVSTTGKLTRDLSVSGMQRLIDIIKASGSPDFYKFGCSVGFLKYGVNEQLRLMESQYGLCDIGSNSITLASNGMITTCVQLLPGNENLGNVKDRNIQDILENPDQDYSSWIHKDQLSHYDTAPCKGCDKLSSCKAGCRAFVRESGSFYDSDPACLWGA